MLGSTGCAQYERRPLNIESYANDWPLREIDIEPVRQYAATVARDESVGPFDLTDGLNLAEAEAIALHFNPALRAARAQAGAPLANAQEAGWWPDPQFEAKILRFADRGQKSEFRFNGPSIDGVNTGVVGAAGLSGDGLEIMPPGIRRSGGEFVEDPMILGAGVNLTIPISGRLAVEKDVKWAEYSAAWRQIIIAEWELLSHLRSAWLEWSTTHERIVVTRDYIERLAAVSAMSDRLADAGEIRPIEARLLRIEAARQRTAMDELEAHERQQRLALLAIMGLAPEAPVELRAAVFVPQFAVQEAERRAALLQIHPRIQAARADYEAAEQRLRLEVRAQYPDLTIGPSFSLEEGLTRLGFGFGFPIPLWNHNRQAVAEAFAERETARARAEATVERALGELARAESRIVAAARRRKAFVQDVAPLVDEQVSETRRLLDLGEIDVLLLRDALSTSLQTKLDILDTTLAEALAAGELQSMLQPRWATTSAEERTK